MVEEVKKIAHFGLLYNNLLKINKKKKKKCAHCGD